MRTKLGVSTLVALSLAGCSDPLVAPNDSAAMDVTSADTTAMVDDLVTPPEDTVQVPDVVMSSDIADVAPAEASADAGPIGSDVVATDTSPATDGGACAPQPASPAQPVSPTLMPERRVTCGCRVGTPSVTAGATDRYLLHGRVVTPVEIHARGEVLIVGSTIACVGASGTCSAMPMAAGATVIQTAGLIYPGLIDGHNHVSYNWMPEWVPPRSYDDRYQWQRATAYDTFIRPYRDNVGTNECAMAKYGEARAIFAGTTTIQGGPNRTCTRVLARNPEYGSDFGGVDTHQTNILGIGTVDAAAAMTLRSNMDSGALTAYIVHLGEGINDASRTEFDTLVSRNLLTRSTVIVHGTAFFDSHHMQIGAAGAKLVWSPRSNIALYGDTTDIRAALARGVIVALAPDWTPSGAPEILQELRYARNLSRARWPGLLSERALVEMVTTQAARALDRPQIGSLTVGRYADLVVFPDYGCDAYSSLIDAVAADTQLVFVAGKPLYGDAALMRAMPAAVQTGCESVDVCGSARTVCLARPGASDQMDQTLAQVSATISGFFPGRLPLVPRCPMP
ncbi:MAG: amidohydrolase family protein [Deltaproteobacteria bacterium]|nr:amidohydrolase family protein [Deltaproteobacteria bacterium]